MWADATGLMHSTHQTRLIANLPWAMPRTGTIGNTSVKRYPD